MKPVILLLAFFSAVLTSCTTAYKTGQTPDDVYYSPVRAQEETVQNDKEETANNKNDEYYDDRYLRMKVRDRYRWSDLDDSYYYNRRYSYSSYNCCCFSNPWSPYTYWNNYYNPYYNNHIVINPAVTTVYNKPRTFNLNAYNNNALTNSNYSNPKAGNTGSSSSSNYSRPRNSSTRSNNNSGNTLRDIFRGSNSSSSGSSSSTNSSSNSTNNSSNSSSSSSSSSSSGSSGSSAPVRKF
jgi:hypothetical protein